MAKSPYFAYTEQQLDKCAKLNAAIDQRNLSPDEYWTGYSLEQVQAVLAQQSPINPEPVLAALWSVIFGTAEQAEIAVTDDQWTDKYSSDDIALAKRILTRLAEQDIKDQGITAASVAKQLNKSSGWISQLINGKYPAAPTSHLHAIWAAIEPAQITEQTLPDKSRLASISLRYGDVPFVRTSMADLIDYTCGHARRARRFSVFAGSPGLGKTYGLNQYIRENPNTLFIVAHELMTATTLLNELSRLLSLPKQKNSSRQMQAIIRTLHLADRIIILDEADKCKPNALDPLRTISDSAQVGIVLIGNTKLTDRLQADDRYELLASRVCFWPTPKGQLEMSDIRTLFETLTQNALPLAANDDTWWKWLHERVEGNARLLCENLLPHLVSVCGRDDSKKVDRLLVNSIFKQVLNKPAL